MPLKQLALAAAAAAQRELFYVPGYPPVAREAAPLSVVEAASSAALAAAYPLPAAAYNGEPLEAAGSPAAAGWGSATLAALAVAGAALGAATARRPVARAGPALMAEGAGDAEAPSGPVAPSATRRAALQQAAAAAALARLPPAAAKDPPSWDVVNLPIIGDKPPIIFDIEFSNKDPNLGWIVGNRGTFLSTTNGGKTWKQQSFANLDPDEEINYRFTKVSFKDGEGWIIGKPALLLHTKDSGTSWERVPLSPKLPGDPYGIVALGPGRAEMSTTAGAIYVTENAGQNWTAQVKETIDATLNRVSSSGVQGASYFSGSINSVQRDASGSYLAVSSRGNFYLTYKPGDEFWVPHNRESSRRITSMGFVKDQMSDGLWMTSAGGEISKTTEKVDTQLINIPFERLQIRSGGYGLLDVAFLPDGKNAWAVGGGGTIFKSTDGGNSWTKDKVADDLPTNLYKIKFFPDGAGYILGSEGVLLRKLKA